MWLSWDRLSSFFVLHLLTDSLPFRSDYHSRFSKQIQALRSLAKTKIMVSKQCGALVCCLAELYPHLVQRLGTPGWNRNIFFSQLDIFFLICFKILKDKNLLNTIQLILGKFTMDHFAHAIDEYMTVFTTYQAQNVTKCARHNAL